MHTRDSRPVPPQLIAWCVFAAIAGVCSLVLPPFLAKSGLSQPAYGWPLIPWFALAWANVRIAASAICFFCVGCSSGHGAAPTMVALGLGGYGLAAVLAYTEYPARLDTRFDESQSVSV